MKERVTEMVRTCFKLLGKNLQHTQLSSPSMKESDGVYILEELFQN